MNENELRDLFVWRQERPGDVFMETLHRDGLIVAPGVYNAKGADIALKIYKERKAAGLPVTFNAIYEGHWSTSCMLLNKPDMGFGDFDFLAKIGQLTVEAANPLPIIFDIETGFGNALTITKTVQKCHDIGVAVIHLEDQDDATMIARRCGNLIGKKCTDMRNMIAKIESCLKVIKSQNSSIRLMVRTDALTAVDCGIENAIERGKRYMGVEIFGLRPTILWADAMYKPQDIDRWIKEFRKFDPNIILGINYSPNRDWTPKTYFEKFKVPPPTFQDLYRNGEGFSVIWHTILQARADMEATYNTFNDMADYGAEALWRLHERQRNHPVGDAQAMSGFSKWQKFEQDMGGDEAIERYNKSEGYKDETKQ